MEIKVSLMNKNGKMENKTVTTELNNFRIIVSKFKAYYNTYVESMDLDRGIVFLGNGLIIEDIAQNKKFKEFKKYL